MLLYILVIYGKQKTKNKLSKRAGLTLAVLVLALIGIGGYLFIDYQNKDKLSGEIDYGPPTTQEKKAGDKIKEEAIAEDKKREESSQQNRSGETENASVIITDAAQYEDVIEVRAFVPDYYQDGTCTITFRQDGHSVTKKIPAYRDVSTTICTNPLIRRMEFPSSGEWQVSVSYQSKDAYGESKSQTVNLR